jgi:hypothetical protein
MDRNQHVLAIAFKRAKGKKGAIARLGIDPFMDNDTRRNLVISLSEAKAKKDNVPVESLIDGQQWYVQSLIDFSALSPLEQLEAEYQDAFPEVASEDELLAALEAM